LQGFGAEIVGNSDPALVQFRETLATFAKAGMPAMPENPHEFLAQIFQFWIEPDEDEPRVVCLRDAVTIY